MKTLELLSVLSLLFSVTKAILTSDPPTDPFTWLALFLTNIVYETKTLAYLDIAVLQIDHAKSDVAPTVEFAVEACGFEHHSCIADTGNIGLRPKFCAANVCQSSCNAKSDCDPGWGAQWSTKETCPLNVYCS